MDFYDCAVAMWNGDRGFGFVKLPDCREIFCHVRAVAQAGLDKLRPGERVDVYLEAGPDGRLRVARLAPSHLRAAAVRASAALSPVRP